MRLSITHIIRWHRGTFLSIGFLIKRLFVKCWGELSRINFQESDCHLHGRVPSHGDILFLGADMKDSVSEAIKVSVTEGISFENFNLVVDSFGEAVSIRTFKGIKYRS